MATKSDLLAEEARKKKLKLNEAQTEAVTPETPKKPQLLKGTGAVLSKGANLGMKGYGAVGEAQGVAGSVQTLTGKADYAGESGAERGLKRTEATTGLAASGASVGKKGLEKGMNLAAKKVLGGGGKKNITDIVKMGDKAGKVGKLAGVAGAVAGVAGFGAQLSGELGQMSSLKTGRGFDTAAESGGRAASLTAGAVGTAATVGGIMAGAGSVAATNFWNPVGWVAAGVGALAAGVSLLGGASKIRGR